jgi:hypothetical protein
MQGSRISSNHLEIKTITIFALFGIAVCWKVSELSKATPTSFAQKVMPHIFFSRKLFIRNV